MNFTMQKLDTVKAKDGNKEVPNFVQVTDNRGTNAGWKLSVTQNDQFKTADGKELTGATLTLKMELQIQLQVAMFQQLRKILH